MFLSVLQLPGGVPALTPTAGADCAVIANLSM